MIEIAAKRSRPARLRHVTVLGALLALIVLVAGAAVFARAYSLRDAVLPGIRVSGIDVGGESRAHAQAAIAGGLEARLARPVRVAVGERSLTVKPSALWQLDAAATEERAFAAGRASVHARLGALIAPFVFERDVEPVLRLQPAERTKLEKALYRLTDRPRNAALRMEGLEPVVLASRNGTEVETDALLAAVRSAALAGTRRVEADLVSVSPKITTEEAETAALQARAVVAAPVVVRFRRERVGELEPRTLAPLIRFHPSGGRYRVTLDGGGLRKSALPMVEANTREPVDAGFEFAGTRVHVVPSRSGTTLSAGTARDAVLAAALEPGTRVARLALTEVPADFTTKEARALGIREQISTYTTEMGTSSANRIWNVHLMADYIDGTIVEPGHTFSFNDRVG